MGAPKPESSPARDQLIRKWARKLAQKLQNTLSDKPVEIQIDLESAKLWNLSPSDLAEIQRAMKELTE